jgi:dienelactone hydrolase
MTTTCQLWSIAILILGGIAHAAEPDAPADLAKRARAFVELVAKNDFEGAAKQYDEAMTKALPPAKLGETWKKIVDESGPFQKQLGTRTEKVGKFDIVIVTCQFEKDKLDVRVVFDSEARVSGLQIRPAKAAVDWKPPTYAKPEAFTEKEIVLGEGGDWPLPGTLTLPKGDGPFPAVVLVHGSGPQDRDESLGADKPFKDLAWGLATQGIVVLRYEKRTKEHGKKFADMPASVTVDREAVDDAVAAAALLRKQPGVDPKRVFIVGHSLGAIVAPRIAERDPAIAGIAMLAGTPRPLEDVILEQVDYLLSLKSDVTEEEKKKVDEIRQQVARLKDPKFGPDTPAKELPFGAPAAYWLSLRAYDPIATAMKLDRPVLVLQGERDYQVKLVDFEAWKKGLKDRPNVRFRSYPKLNHLFIEGEGKSTPEDYDKPGHVAPEVIDDVAAWLKKPR